VLMLFSVISANSNFSFNFLDQRTLPINNCHASTQLDDNNIK
jgi:hypothetical protein